MWSTVNASNGNFCARVQASVSDLRQTRNASLSVRPCVRAQPCMRNRNIRLQGVTASRYTVNQPILAAACGHGHAAEWASRRNICISKIFSTKRIKRRDGRINSTRDWQGALLYVDVFEHTACLLFLCLSVVARKASLGFCRPSYSSPAVYSWNRDNKSLPGITEFKMKTSRRPTYCGWRGFM